MRRCALLAASGVGLAALPGQAGWPSRIVVIYPPGGSNDVVAHSLHPKLQAVLGQSIIVENRGGAPGSVGGSEVVQAAPDGHTWLLANDTVATSDTLMSLPYHVCRPSPSARRSVPVLTRC